MAEEHWTAPNQVGSDRVYEGLCPPYCSDVRAAVEAFVERKFGTAGAYDPDGPGPWKASAEVKGTVSPYSDEMVDCLAEIAAYVYDEHGKFPGTVPTIVPPGYVQAHHLEAAYYDAHCGPGAYLETHADHLETWHDGGA